MIVSGTLQYWISMRVCLHFIGSDILGAARGNICPIPIVVTTGRPAGVFLRKGPLDSQGWKAHTGFMSKESMPVQLLYITDEHLDIKNNYLLMEIIFIRDFVWA